MGNRKIDDGSKMCAIRLLRRGRDTVPEILRVVKFSRSTFYRSKAQYERRGTVEKRAAPKRGRPRRFTRADWNFLKGLSRWQPTTFLDEYEERLARDRGLFIDPSIISREFKRHNIKVKKVNKAADERDPIKIASYIRQVAPFTPDMLIFVDETAKDERTSFRWSGRAPAGQRVVVEGPFIRGDRYSLLPALTVDGIIAHKVIKGSFKKHTFYDFLRHHLLPQCNAFPGPRSVIIMDNAKIHHSVEVEELCDAFGVKLVYLSPYSPHLNPIELVFGIMKAHIRRLGNRFRRAPSPYWALTQECSLITPEIARACFAHDGYW